MQRRLIALHLHQIVAPRVANRLGDLRLREQRVGGHHPPGQHQTREQIVNRRDLVGFVRHRHLTEHHAEALAERAQQMGVRRAALALQRSVLPSIAIASNGSGASAGAGQHAMTCAAHCANRVSSSVAVDALEDALHGGLARAIGAGEAEGCTPRRAIVLRPLGDGDLAARPAEHRHAREEEHGAQRMAHAARITEIGEVGQAQRRGVVRSAAWIPPADSGSDTPILPEEFLLLRLCISPAEQRIE